MKLNRRISRRSFLAAAGVSAAALALTACGGSSSSTASSAASSTASSAAASSEAASTSGSSLNTDTTTLYINQASEPDYLDPALNSSVDGAVLAINSFAGLMTYDSDNNIVEAIADSYTVSDDKLSYVFTLKQTKWSDGTDLTAKDFVYSWNRARNPLTASDYSYLFDGLIEVNSALDTDADGNYLDQAAADEAMAANDILVGVEATDDYTLSVQLVSPCPYFLSLCAFPTFFPVPQASVEAANPDGTNPGAWCQEAGFVSNGAYTCTAWSHDESMTYTKNPNFYDADNVTIEKLSFMLSADDTATYAAYNAGNLDFIDSIPTDEMAAAKATDEYYCIDNLGTYYIGFNVNSTLFEGKTEQQAKDMRHAMCLLIDRQYIVDNVGQADQKIAATYIPTAASDGNGGIFNDGYTYPVAEVNGYYDPSEDAYDANLAEAVELLKSAGYEFDDNNMLSSSTPLKFTYLINDSTGHKKVAEAIQQDLAAVGIEIEIETVDWNVLLDDRKAGNFDVAREGWLMDFDDPVNMLEICLTDGGNNDMQLGRTVDGKVPDYAPQNWSDFDDLVAQIKSETDFAKRADLMHQAEDMIMDTWSCVPLYYYTDPYMLKSNVSGVYGNAFGYKFFMYATKTEG